MELLQSLINDSSNVHIRTKEEVEQLFNELSEKNQPIDNTLDLKIRMAIQQVKLQFFYESKLTEYRQKLKVGCHREVATKPEQPVKQKKKRKEKIVSHRQKLKVIKAEAQTDQKRQLSDDDFMLIISHTTIDAVVDFLKTNKQFFDAIIERWIRQRIIERKLLDYYIVKMSNEFSNYQTEVHRITKLKPSNNPQIRERIISFQNKIIPIIKNIEQPSNPKPITEGKKPTSFEILKTKEWILDWKCVIFKRGYIQIYASSYVGVKFNPTTASAPNSLESFNYLKNYLNDRLPPVRCIIEGLTLKIIDQINFNEAIQRFTEAARQGVINASGGRQIKLGAPSPMSFYQALSRARQMNPEEFKKYKSQFIDFLVSLQSKKYKVVPCVERLSHANSDVTEYAFMFSLECRSGNVLIVYENINPDRSTLLFWINESAYEKAIREIYNFLQSAELNKRSALRDKSINVGNAGVIRYKSINHDDILSWKRTIKVCTVGYYM